MKMKGVIKTPQQYIDSLPEDRKSVIEKLHKIIMDHLPPGFQETINYGMIGFVVPLNLYPKGYLCDSSNPLPFISLASTKNYISLHHMGIIANPELEKWFKEEYPKHTPARLDMGKSCIRFRNPDQIPYELIAQLVSKITVEEWIAIYEKSRLLKK